MGHTLSPTQWTAAVIETTAAAMLVRTVARFEAARNATLASTDVRYLMLQRCCRALAQKRADIATARAVGLLRFIDADWIELHDDIYGEEPDGPEASEVTIRFTWTPAGPFTIPINTRVTDGTNVWKTTSATTVSAPGATYSDITCTCTETGTDSNDVAAGEIDTLVDPLAGIVSVTNLAASAGGTDGEETEDYRERLRGDPEASSVAGNRRSYAQIAKDASSQVLDARCIGPNDAGALAGSTPAAGNVRILITQVGDIDPATSLLNSVYASMLLTLSMLARYPATDTIAVGQPTFVDVDVSGTYYIDYNTMADPDDATELEAIKDAVEAAVLEYVDWQCEKIGRDINPSELISRMLAAGAKRVTLTDPVFVALKRDECALPGSYLGMVYGSTEDE